MIYKDFFYKKLSCSISIIFCISTGCSHTSHQKISHDAKIYIDFRQENFIKNHNISTSHKDSQVVESLQEVFQDTKQEYFSYFSQDKNRDIRQKMLEEAITYLNTPYRYGGKNKDGLDCSGFIYVVTKKFFNDYPYHSSSQIGAPNSSYFIEIPEYALQPADIVWWRGHVAFVFDPKKKTIIHASTQEKKVTISSWNNVKKTQKRFLRLRYFHPTTFAQIR